MKLNYLAPEAETIQILHIGRIMVTSSYSGLSDQDLTVSSQTQASDWNF